MTDNLKFGTFGLALLMGLDAHAASVYVGDIKIEGLERVEPETVISYVDIKKNAFVNDEKLDTSLKQLYATGLFEDISLNVNNDGTLIIKVAENPVINKVLFDGNDKVDDEMLQSEIKLAPRSTYSRSKVQEDVARILEVYKRSGRYAAIVEPQIIRRDQNRVDLIFNINEGPLAVIDKINFMGNRHYSHDDLQEVIMSKESRWYRIFSSSENYDAEKTNYDKELLRRFYAKRGYADFRVVSAIAELTPDNRSFVLTYVVDEGKRYKIKDIKIASTMADVDTSDFTNIVEVKKDDWYNADKIEKSISALTDELGKKGFAFVDVEPELIKDTETGDMNVLFHVREGERVFVDRINITGNTRTHDKVIRREFRIEEGDAFNVSKLRDSRRNVENLDYFSKVDIDTVSKDQNKADVNVNVEEKSTGYFNVGIGYSTVNGATVRAGVTENNFRGQGQRLSVDASVSERAQEYDLSFTEPYFLNRRLRAGFDLFRSEEDYQDESSYDSSTTGGRLRLGWNYTDDLSQQFRYTLRQDEITNVGKEASKYIKDEEGEYVDSSIGQTLVYDKRDSAINTKDGYFLSFGNDVSGLGGDEKYAKFDAKAYKYFTLADYYTFKLFMNAGYITGYGGKDVRLSNRYYLGGSTLRGFDVAGIGARDKYTQDALGGNWMVYTGGEVTFPIGLDELGIKGRTFVDIGALGKPDNFNAADVEYSSSPRVAAGFGFQWLSPMGQIDIDFGFPIVKEDYDETQVFRLNFGTRL
ncbi:MAG: outer membrane protein assembly factor BamA [Alphaproteobacteria bacterium]|nr:outer membrane protein assembly factor BamA [Alphaproteobacteria bacterium]MBQ7286120.1 outer membrane protein assembly factor BamA [Alphaproteobacteria bacterium]